MPPGAGLRLRALHPIPDADKEVAYLYDLERTMVFDVPLDLEPALLHGLHCGPPFDQALHRWLVSEELLTPETPPLWREDLPVSLPQVTDISLDLAGTCNLSCVYCFERDLSPRPGSMTPEVVVQAVDFAFRVSPDTRKLTFHFGSGEPLLRPDLLHSVVELVRRRSKQAGVEVGFELTTNGTRITPELALFLRQEAFNVRVSCDGPPEIQNANRPFRGGGPSYAEVMQGLATLLEHLSDRTTVNSVRREGTRLRTLWTWAKEIGLKHYHVVEAGSFQAARSQADKDEIDAYRTDLQSIADDILENLQNQRTAIEFQPLTKVVRRLMLPQPITRFCGSGSTYLGVSQDGMVYPCFRYLGDGQHRLGDIVRGIDDTKRAIFRNREAASVDDRISCRDCWARYLCGGGCYADSSAYGSRSDAPLSRHCTYRRIATETAIRLYRRMIYADPVYCLRLFEDPADENFEVMLPFAFARQKNCQ